MTPACPAIREYGKHRGTVCGRDVVAFILPGQGRCGYHNTVIERARARAVLDAVRQTRELRACPREPDGGEDEQSPESDPGTDSEADFDPSGFADPSLDEG